MKTLEQYLRENHQHGVIDHIIRVSSVGDGGVAIYIHPHGHNGDTLDFGVSGSTVWSRGGSVKEE